VRFAPPELIATEVPQRVARAISVGTAACSLATGPFTVVALATVLKARTIASVHHLSVARASANSMSMKFPRHAAALARGAETRTVANVSAI